MSNKVEYKTINDVHKAFRGWESEGKARAFGIALWEIAEKCVRAGSDKDYDARFKNQLPDEVFLVLYQRGSLRLCLTDGLRKLVIRYHARGLSTSAATQEILDDDNMASVTPFWLFKHADVCGYRNIKDFLVSRLSYLKPSHPRFPKKFADYWRSERAAYVDRIQDIPLSHPVEQLNKLSAHYADLEMAYSDAQSAVDKERYHKCMLRTMAAIHLITRDPSINALPTTRKAIPESSPTALPTPKEEVIDIPTVETVVVKTSEVSK